MAHSPRHPDNPCSLDENEQIPAKIWELLRRNECFAKAVARLRTLDQDPKFQDTGAVRRNLEIAYTMVRHMEERSAFAATALKWMVPNPLFQIRQVAIPKGLDLRGRQFVSLFTVKLQQGTTADPADKDHWRTFEAQGDTDAESMANHNGQPMRRGPDVSFQTSDDTRFCSKVNPVEEWRAYFSNGKRFTLETPWREAPPQFKREFCFHWRHLDSRATNPITGTRIDVPCEHETHFFQDWSLLSAMCQNPTESESLARVWTFDRLAHDYRVFAFPKSIRSRTEARRVANWLMEQLCSLPNGGKLPLHEPDILGTPLQWDVFLFAGQCNDESLLDAYRQAKPEVPPIGRQKKWRKERLNYAEYYRAISREIAGIFPRVKVSGK
jgi:hypothetical protein